MKFIYVNIIKVNIFICRIEFKKLNYPVSNNDVNPKLSKDIEIFYTILFIYFAY